MFNTIGRKVSSILGRDTSIIPANLEWPDKAWHERENQMPPYTPDILELEKKGYHWVFEYGDLQARMPKHNMINAAYSCTAYTVNKYAVLKQSAVEEPFPIAFEHDVPGRKVPHSKIRGELYAVPLSNHLLIDSYRQNGVYFYRRRIKVLVPEQTQTKGGDIRNVTRDAWMYLGNKDYWTNMLVWDSQFYRGRAEGRDLFTPLKTFKHPSSPFNNHARFLADDLKPVKRPKCYIGLRNSDTTQMIQGGDRVEEQLYTERLNGRKEAPVSQPVFILNSQEEIREIIEVTEEGYKYKDEQQ